jgi:hypothetical protein
LKETKKKTMNEDWENDDYVPVLNTTAVGDCDREERKEEDLLDEVPNEQKVVAKLTEEQKAARAAEEEAAFMKKIEATKLKEETADERRRRERLLVEEADHELANELFEGMSSLSLAAPAIVAAAGTAKPKIAGLANIPLATNQDHFEFGNLVSIRLQDSTAFNLVAFYKGLSKSLHASRVSVESLNDVLNDITKIRDSKAKVLPGKKGEPAKKTAAERKKDAKKHEDVFGFSEKVSKYDHYEVIEDEYSY